MARRLTLAVLAATLLAAGCAEDPEIDVAALEVSIADWMLPAIVEAVDCPDPLPVEPQTVTCTGAIDGVRVEFQVELSPGEDDDVLADVVTDAPLLDLTEVAVAAGERLSDDLGVVALVRCEAPVVVIEPRREIACVVTDLADGVERPLVIRLLDPEGGWEMDLFG